MPNNNPRSLPAAAFDDVGFWDARYSVDDAAFEWYEGPSVSIAISAIEEALKSAANGDDERLSTSSSTRRRFSLLDIGCGTSLVAERISEEHHDKFEKVVACDASSVAIEKQQLRQEDRRKRDDATTTPPHLLVSYEVADAFALPYPDSSFDAVVDKGTADALDCAGCEDSAAKVIAGAAAVLKPGGVFVMVSCREPKRRFSDFERANEIVDGDSSPRLVVSRVVGEIRKSASDPCANAHVFVAVKARKVDGDGAAAAETTAEAAARAVADAAARSAASAASAATKRES